MESQRKHKVLFQPMGVRAEVEEGVTLRQAANEAGLAINSICGERLTCGKCKVVIQRGSFSKEGIVSSDDHLSPPSTEEAAYWERRRAGLEYRGEDASAYRLSCQARVLGDLVVTVPESSSGARQVVRKAARERAVQVRPNLRKIYVELKPATLEDPRGDWDRLQRALHAADPLTRRPGEPPLGELTISLPVLRQLQEVVRKGEWKVTATVRGGNVVTRVQPGYEELLVGLAIDIGTTTIAAHLCDLESGETLTTVDMMNPQVSYGEDIMSRMTYALESGAPEQLHKVVVGAVNDLARRAARQVKIKPEEIMELVVVGNSVMHHFFLGLDTHALGRAPYVPAVHAPLEVNAHELGITHVNPGATVYTLPLIASFVGADCMAVILAEAPHEQDETWLIIDVGTNAELVLGNRQRLVCTSTPTGPAFEGAHVEYGMRAAEGAIERVQIDPETRQPRFKVIGSETWSDDGGVPAPARGICGSGIIDAVAELYRAGIIRPDGRFINQQEHNLGREKGGPAFTLARPDQTSSGSEIPITQEDVRQIQLAKAPLYVAAHYLLKTFGLEHPDRILLAGGFGSYIDPLKAMMVGMIPDCPLDRVHAVGNSAGDGARLALLDREKRREAVELLGRLERIELPVQPGFQDQFMLALSFPHMLDPYPHLEGFAPPRKTDPMAKRFIRTAPSG
jgi:uncharacterized 2Fe-2S/4Fe-4S cluster protein (DUF4445 family)